MTLTSLLPLVIMLALEPRLAGAQTMVPPQNVDDAAGSSLAGLAGKLILRQSVNVRNPSGLESSGLLDNLSSTSLRLTVEGQGSWFPEVPAQTTAPSPARVRPDRTWAAAFLLGTSSSGPARDFEQAMRDAQFDESRRCFFICSGSDPHPVSHTGFGAEGFPWQVSLQRRLSSWSALGVSAGRTPIGRTIGLKRDLFLDHLSISYGVTTVAPLFVIGPARGFHAAAGPALVSTTFADAGAGGGPRGSHRDVGFVTEFGGAVPSRSRVFGEFLAQYRYVGNVTAGPFTTSASGSSGSTLPATEVSMNHWFLGFGAGVRF